MALQMDPERRRKLEALSRLHDEWETQYAKDAEFRPEQHPEGDSDYNVHHVDVDPPADAEREFMHRAREVMGLDRETGFPPRAGA
jgi:hypothetical protein